MKKISACDEIARITTKWEKVKERLRSLGQAFVDSLYDDVEYRRQKQALTSQLESLATPDVDLAGQAGVLLSTLPRLWQAATPPERRRLITSIPEAVHVDLRICTVFVSATPKPAFVDLIDNPVIPG